MSTVAAARGCLAVIYVTHRYGRDMSDDNDVAVQDAEMLRLISGAFDVSMKALDEVDLADLPLEPDLDPSRAPR